MRKQCRVCCIRRNPEDFADRSTACIECVDNYQRARDSNGTESRNVMKRTFAQDHHRQRRIQVYRARAKRGLPLFV